MGGGGGGYDRRSGDSTGGSGDSDKDEPSGVPAPESDPEEENTEDHPNESNEETVEEAPEGTAPTSGGSGEPVANPRGESGDDALENDQQVHEDKPEGEQADDSDDQEDGEEEDECLIAETALLHSPNPEPLEDASEDDICSVRLRDQAICIVDSQSRTIGAIAEPWIDTLKECLEQGRQYRARILDIEGGRCEVRITNKCLLKRDVKLTSLNTGVRDILYPELSLSVQAADEGVVVVNADGTQIGNVPNPWARLLSECIDQGKSYQAVVRDITSEYCRVTIKIGSIDE